ncbi:hypothetical protein DFH09DRAFT_1076893 [Mycena vulgaris]|nr:hypothetical protein DFH09DRAFT_1076893 [Mycena vulgaris]
MAAIHGSSATCLYDCPTANESHPRIHFASLPSSPFTVHISMDMKPLSTKGRSFSKRKGCFCSSYEKDGGSTPPDGIMAYWSFYGIAPLVLHPAFAKITRSRPPYCGMGSHFSYEEDGGSTPPDGVVVDNCLFCGIAPFVLDPPSRRALGLNFLLHTRSFHPWSCGAPLSEPIFDDLCPPALLLIRPPRARPEYENAGGSTPPDGLLELRLKFFGSSANLRLCSLQPPFFSSIFNLGWKEAVVDQWKGLLEM